MSGHRPFQDLDPVRVVKTELMPNDNIIAIMGPTGSGKSTFISAAAGRDLGVGHGLQSHTSQITAVRVLRRRDPVVLVDTPGFDDTYLSDLDILKLVSDWLRATAGKELKLTGIVYLHRISDNRVAGTTLKNLDMFQRLCGKDRFDRVVLTTTMWPGASEQPEEYKAAEAREEELCHEYWAAMIERKSKTVRFKGGQESAWLILDEMVRNKKQSIKIQRELLKRWKDVPDTAAGKQLQGILGSMIERQGNTLRQLVGEIAKTTDQDIREVLMKEWLALREEQDKAARDKQQLELTLLGSLKRFLGRGKSAGSQFPYEDRCHDLISDILKNTQQCAKLVDLYGPYAETIFDFLVAVLRRKPVLATKEQRHIISLLYHLSKRIIQPGTPTSPPEVVTVAWPQPDIRSKGYDLELMILPEDLRGRRGIIEGHAGHLICDVFDCLVSLHSRGFIHGNLEARNIVSDGGRAVVTCLAASDITEDGSTNDSPRNTTRWKAPEILAGSPLTTASDVWSFGCLCYEILVLVAGEHQHNYQAVMDDLSKGRPPNLQNEILGDNFSWIPDYCWSSDFNTRRGCDVIRPFIDRLRNDHPPFPDVSKSDKISLPPKPDSPIKYDDVYGLLLSIIRSDTTIVTRT